MTNHLRHQLKTQGKVQIPQLTAARLISKISLPIAIALLGIGLLWIVPDSRHYGPLMVAVSMFAAAIVVLWMEIRDLPRRLTVTPQTLRYGRHKPISWSDIEKIGTPISNGFLSIHLSVDGYLHYEGDTLPNEDTLELLQNSEDRVIVWELIDPISPDELRFLRDQFHRRTT